MAHFSGFFMSLEAILDLGLFETISTSPSSSEACNTGINSGDPNSSSSHPSVMLDTPCACPSRTIPKCPEILPFPAIPENYEKMEAWLKEYFGSSRFSIFPDQALPYMSGPPVEIHLKDGAVPYKAQTAASIPLH